MTAPKMKSAEEWRCRWWTGTWPKHIQCENRAEWGRGNWILCGHHKTLLLNSYNAESRNRETPEWKPI